VKEGKGEGESDWTWKREVTSTQMSVEYEEGGRERRGGNLYAPSLMKKNIYATSKIRR
jgi:hypothetical protein